MIKLFKHIAPLPGRVIIRRHARGCHFGEVVAGPHCGLRFSCDKPVSTFQKGKQQFMVAWLRDCGRSND
jgi:hypothetical protein